jgi:hypothetical protein
MLMLNTDPSEFTLQLQQQVEDSASSIKEHHSGLLSKTERITYVSKQSANSVRFL